MPNINITELDLTSPGILNVTTNTAYVPGYSQYVPEDYDGRPRLYETLSAFQEDFGSVVPVLGLNMSGVTEVEKPDTDPVEYEYPESMGAIEYCAKNATSCLYDKGYIYATELLRLGLPVLYHCIDCVPRDKSGNRIASYKRKLVRSKAGALQLEHVSETNCPTVFNQDLSSVDETATWTSIQAMLENTDEAYGPGLKDKSFYNIKFITTGGYTGAPTYKEDKRTKELVIDSKGYDMKAVAIAVERGDCVAIIDHPHHSANEFKPKKLYDNLPDLSLEQEKYATLFTPYGYYEIPALSSLIVKTVEMPASFGYLLALASAVKTSPNWMAMAGCQRGQIPYLSGLAVELTEAQCKAYSKRDGVSINPITEVSPYGLIIWGNRTLYSNPQGNLTASSFLNIRNLCSDVKKTVWSASRQLTFEQNSDILWVKFKSLIIPTLDQMVTGNGISAYQLKKRVAKQKATLSAIIRLYAIEAVEDFEIEIQLADSSTEILE